MAAPSEPRVEPGYAARRHARLRAPEVTLSSAASPLDSTLPSSFELAHAWLSAFDLGASGFHHEGPQRESVYFDLLLTPDEAEAGGRFELAIPFRASCACGGAPGCDACGGAGEHRFERHVTALVPPRVRDGQEATLPLAAVGLPGIEVGLRVRVL